MLRKLIGAGLILGLLTGIAVAQLPMPGISFGGDSKRKLTPEEQAKQDAMDKAYNSAIQKIPEKKANDPWGNIRQAPATSQSSNK
jgi:hypothetical protein